MEEIGNNLKNNLKTRTLICEQVTLPIINPPNHNIVTYNFQFYLAYRIPQICIYLILFQYRPYLM